MNLFPFDFGPVNLVGCSAGRSRGRGWSAINDVTPAEKGIFESDGGEVPMGEREKERGK